MAEPDARLMRVAMSRFASGVTVVTTVAGDGSPAGCTVSAFCPLSVRPPLVLVCIGKRRYLHALLTAADRFAVNVLRTDQRELARRFAEPGADRFAMTRWKPGHLGVPMLDGAIAHVQCRRWTVVDGGDHTIIVGRVTDAATADGPPLLYARGLFLETPAG